MNKNFTQTQDNQTGMGKFTVVKNLGGFKNLLSSRSFTKNF